VDVLVPYDRGDLISRIHEQGEVLTSEHVADGTRVRAKVTPAIEADLSDYVVA
jgi:GTP-binding protein HflX